MRPEAGHVAVITGGASGIGLTLGDALARRGLSIVLADLDATALETAAAQLAAHGVAVMTVPTDVTDQAAVDHLAALTIERFGHVDVVVNNAGVIGKVLPLWEFEHVEWEWILGVDLWGVIHGIRSFVPHLVAQGSGHVVNTASVAGLSIVAQVGPYAAAKHAVVSISETLRSDLDLRAPNVGVTVLCPGPTATPLITGGDRSRPAHLRPTVDAGARPIANQATVSAVGALQAPEDVAEATLEAMEHNRLYVAPHEQSVARISQRLARLERDIPGLRLDATGE